MIELLRVVNGESVKRFRAMIQNDPEHPKFLPTNWTVAKMRRWKKDEWKLALGYSTLTPADHIEQYEHEKHMRSIEHEREIVC